MDFAQIGDEGKHSILQAVETSNPNFFQELVRQIYNGYYTNPQIFELIGFHQPAVRTQGGLPELLDDGLLENQRQRSPFWKQA